MVQRILTYVTETWAMNHKLCISAIAFVSHDRLHQLRITPWNEHRQMPSMAEEFSYIEPGHFTKYYMF